MYRLTCIHRRRKKMKEIAFIDKETIFVKESAEVVTKEKKLKQMK
ncbi:hypothetical protein RV07_GL000413 [Enterococcus malodoratus]|nr:hypothetical protein RV07_GL000413 [Enterococcus malodoratus]